MATHKAYAEKLKDPRWQKKRLEVFEHDKWTCKECGATDKTLNVHHLFYHQGFDPWDYAKEELITLCDDCHTHISNIIKYGVRIELSSDSVDDILSIINISEAMVCAIYSLMESGAKVKLTVTPTVED